MAIVINGSGTVTGISVGGLPDGIVDSGTLATNSVDSAELIDGSIDLAHLAADSVDGTKIADDAIDSEHYAAGSIDTAHIGTDQITSAILPAGSVIQVVGSTRTASFSTSSTTYTATGLACAITPTDASSKILITMMFGFSIASSDAAYWTIERSITGGSDTTLESHNEGLGGAQTASYRGLATLNYLDSPSTTSVCTYKLLVRNTSGGTIEVPAWSNATATVTLQEVAG